MTILKNKMKRREFLRSLSKAGLILPFASQFGLMKKAFAAPGGAKRYVQFFYPNGHDMNRWHLYPTGSFNQDSFNHAECALRPLAAHIDNVLAIKGLGFGAGGKNQGLDGGHEIAPHMVLSGGDYNGRTIESHIARHLNVNPMYVGVRCNGGLSPFRIDDNASVVPEQNPQSFYDNNFKPLEGSATSGPSEQNLKQRKVLEALEENIDVLQTNALNEKETQKLAIYDDSLAFYRSVLESDINFGGFKRPSIGVGLDNRVDPELEAIAQIDNMVMAFASDFTRVAGFQFIQINQNPIFQNFASVNEWMGEYALNGPKWNHNETQTHSASHSAGTEGNGHVLNAQTAWYNMMVADFITKLKAIPDPVFDGSLFDNTVMMMMSENGHGNGHGNDNLGIYVIAGDNTNISTGKGIDVGGSRGPADLQYELTNAFEMGWNGYAQSNGAGGIPGMFS